MLEPGDQINVKSDRGAGRGHIKDDYKHGPASRGGYRPTNLPDTANDKQMLGPHGPDSRQRLERVKSNPYTVVLSVPSGTATAFKSSQVMLLLYPPF